MVFQCYAEDQVYLFEQQEFPIIEKRIEELRKTEKADKSTLSYFSEDSISSSKISDSSLRMREFLAQEKKRMEEEAQIFSGQDQQIAEVQEINMRVANKFLLDAYEQNDSRLGIRGGLMKKASFGKKSFITPTSTFKVHEIEPKIVRF